MVQIKLTQKKPVVKPNLPVDAEVISPDNFCNKNIDEISELILWRGNKQLYLKELFSISSKDWNPSKTADIEIILEGELQRFKRIGQKMTDGLIHVKGSIGMHLGYQLSGGKIIVDGNTDDFAGANMKAGEIIIEGSAGHYLGGSTRGEWRGMSGGKITVKESVGNECGIWMRKGIIEIIGNAHMFLGMHLHQGSIIVQGNVTERAGAEMTGGTIIIQGILSKLLPSFEFIAETDDIAIKNYDPIKGTYLEFHGDFAERKQGKLFLKKNKNEHHLK